jgi:hypothetical protein
VRVVRTSVQAPEANGIAERFVRTVRSECLDWLLILNARHLEHTVKVFVEHYTSGRPHRSLGWSRPTVVPGSIQKRSVSGSMCDGVTGLAAAARVRARGLSEIGLTHPTGRNVNDHRHEPNGCLLNSSCD